MKLYYSFAATGEIKVLRNSRNLELDICSTLVLENNVVFPHYDKYHYHITQLYIIIIYIHVYLCMYTHKSISI